MQNDYYILLLIFFFFTMCLALTKAWKAACAVAGSKVVISARLYKLGLVTLLGPCKGAIEFNLQGTL